MYRKLLSILLLLGFAMISRPALAALQSFQTYVGPYAVSTSGWGSTTQSGTISATVPAGVTVVAAFLYTSLHDSSTGSAGGTFQGTAVTYASLGGLPSAGLYAGRVEVTSIVRPIVEGGAGGTYSFSIAESSGFQDGSALVIVYSKPEYPTSTVAILDGFSNTAGDSATLSFAQPLNPASPGFFAEMRLGIGFSCCDQRSSVRVNGTLITENAGNNDDAVGALANGNLITVGGDNDPFSPLLPTYAQDKERYNIAPQIVAGSSSVTVTTSNPSGDDNIFLAVFYVSGSATVTTGGGPPKGKTFGENLACGLDALRSLTPAQVMFPGHANLLISLLNNVPTFRTSSPNLALASLDNVIKRTNGCTLRGTVDRSPINGLEADYITDCTPQNVIYACLIELRTQLTAP